MSIIKRSVLFTAFCLALAGVAGCDPGSDEPRAGETTSGSEKPRDEGVIPDDTFGTEGIIDDDAVGGGEGLVDDETFGDDGAIPD